MKIRVLLHFTAIHRDLRWNYCSVEIAVHELMIHDTLSNKIDGGEFKMALCKNRNR